MSGSQRYPVSMPPPGMAGRYGARPGVNPRGRALPIVVACGLAMGVFAGLLVVRGTGEGDAAPPPVAAAVVSPSVPVSTTPTSPSATPPSTAPAADKPASDADKPAADKPASDADKPAADKPASDADKPAAQSGVAVVSFSVRPRRAHIFVNGEELAGTSTDIPLAGGSATIEVVVRGRGYKTHTKSYTISGDEKIEVSLRPDRRDEGPGSLLDIR
jgi:hypothetical protein